MQREQKKIAMEEKIQEWLNVKKEQVDDRCFKLIVVLSICYFPNRSWRNKCFIDLFN